MRESWLNRLRGREAMVAVSNGIDQRGKLSYSKSFRESILQTKTRADEEQLKNVVVMVNSPPMFGFWSFGPGDAVIDLVSRGSLAGKVGSTGTLFGLCQLRSLSTVPSCWQHGRH